MSTTNGLAWPRLIPVGAVTVAVGLGVVLPTITGSYPWRDLVLFLLGGATVGFAFSRPSLSIVLVVVSFIFSAWLRRLLPAVNPSTDLSAIIPFVVALPLATHGLKSIKPVSVTLLVGWVTLRAAVSFDFPLVGLAGWLNLAVPLLAAFGIARIHSGLSTFARATVICGSIAATYGVVQYFVPFSWDVDWVLRTDFENAGLPGNVDFRPFATLPATGTGAIISAVVILVLVFRSDLVRPSVLLRSWALASSSIYLLLTQVRSVWLALLVALLVGLFAARGRPARQLLPLGAFVVVVVLVFPPGELVVDRIDTLGNLQQDVSYRARLDLLAQTGSLISPIGNGVGTLSAGSRAQSDASIDNGYLIILGELGLLGAVLLACVLVWTARRSQPSEYALLTLLLVTSATGFAFGGFPGLLMWAFVGAGRPQATDDEAEVENGHPRLPTPSPRRLGLPTQP
jgi:O-antigen ligase